jgi:8-oxo-dGTP pyrophosphatase MutT (NUDIX family)
MSDPSNIIKKVSAGGIVHQNGKYLTIRWLSEGTVEIPKGTVEPNESIEEACVREIFEETGYNTEIVAPLTVSNFTFDWHNGKTYNKTVYYFLLRRIDNKKSTPNREDNEDFENKWQDAETTLNSLSFDDMKEAMQKAINIVEASTAQ